MLVIANSYADGVISSAAVVTLAGFVGLTAIVFYTRKDFSFLGAMLKWAGLLALGAIAGAVLLGFELGTWFSVAMVAVAGGAILYDTSNILRYWPNDRYVEPRPWNCSPRWPSCSGTSCGCSWGRGAD